MITLDYTQASVDKTCDTRWPRVRDVNHVFEIWCIENIGRKVGFGHIKDAGVRFYFETEEDAMMFKLKW